MGWLAVPAGLAYGLNAAISGLSIGRKQAWTAGRLAGAWALLAFAIFAVPAVLATAGAVRGGVIVDVATYVCAAGVVGIGIDAVMRIIESQVGRQLKYLFPIGFAAFHLWVGIVSVAMLIGGALPAGLGWLGIVSIGGFVAGITVIVSMPEASWGTGRAWFLASFGPQAGVAVWTVWLGLRL